jgi:hypothetical protein
MAADRKAFLVRIDPALHEALQRWADADFRSLNAQIEFILRRALRDAGRQTAAERREPPDPAAAPPTEREEES